MNQPTLQSLQRQAGAVFTEAYPVPHSYGNDTLARQAAFESVALCDRSHWALLKLAGEDSGRFLHNQSTNDIEQLQPGQGCDTVFVTSTARTLDLASVYATEAGYWILASPNRRQRLLQWIDQYIFPMDRVELTDHSEEFAIFSLIGPGSADYIKELGYTLLPGAGDGQQYQHYDCGDAALKFRLCEGTGLGLPGYTLLVPAGQGAIAWEHLQQGGVVPLGQGVWEQLRITQGRPLPEQELTEDYNPLEAGLWQAISFDKGCYIGQETIARLNTYKGVKQRLWGITLPTPCPVQTPVMLQEKKVGTVTSCTQVESEAIALVYVSTKAGGAGTQVQVDGVTGTLQAMPFLSHEYHE